MQVSRKIVFFAALAASMLVLAGCPKEATVAEIKQNPSHFMNKEVAIRGNVSDSYGLMGNGAYEVDDGTGKIWVLSEGYGVPNKGAQVTVVGDLVDTFSFGGRSF